VGFINQAKSNQAGAKAREAYQRGEWVLAYKIIEANKSSMATGPLTGVGEQIAAIEAEGWALDKMAAAESKTIGGERIGLICLFRRRQ
jgi:hypothetical protein